MRPCGVASIDMSPSTSTSWRKGTCCCRLEAIDGRLATIGGPNVRVAVLSPSDTVTVQSYNLFVSSILPPYTHTLIRIRSDDLSQVAF